MTLVVRLKKPGGVDQLEVMEIALPRPGPGEILVRQSAIGLNFLDIYHRTGLYPLTSEPAVLGVEGAGHVAAVGPDVMELQVGDRIAYAGAPIGAYASERLLPAARAILLPAAISDDMAATVLLKGLTAHMLLTLTFTVVPGTTLLVHAAAGGLGSLLTRWAKHLGAIVIGTVSSESKAEMARANGADHIIVGRASDFARDVMRFTDGRGVDFAYDGIGGATLHRTFTCVRRFGTVASLGQPSGPIPAVDVEELGPVRALSLSRPSVMAYASDPECYKRGAAELFELLRGGVAPPIGRRYPLEQAARAHTDLEAGRTTGSLLLVP
jgi:NADPH2:quinone reductase